MMNLLKISSQFLKLLNKNQNQQEVINKDLELVLNNIIIIIKDKIRWVDKKKRKSKIINYHQPHHNKIEIITKIKEIYLVKISNKKIYLLFLVIEGKYKDQIVQKMLIKNINNNIIEESMLEVQVVEVKELIYLKFNNKTIGRH